MHKLLKFSPYVYKEKVFRKHARETEHVFKESVLVATTRGGRVAPGEVDSNDSDDSDDSDSIILAGQPIGLLLALTYAD